MDAAQRLPRVAIYACGTSVHVQEKKGRGNVFFLGLVGKGISPGDSELASTWLISVFDIF